MTSSPASQRNLFAIGEALVALGKVVPTKSRSARADGAHLVALFPMTGAGKPPSTSLRNPFSGTRWRLTGEIARATWLSARDSGVSMGSPLTLGSPEQETKRATQWVARLRTIDRENMEPSA